MNRQQWERMGRSRGFIAALDQSGGSTPKALALYGIAQDAYAGEAQMFDLVHAMRTRIITSPGFTSEHILGAILFEQTMDRTVDGLLTADYLWQKKGIVPFVKVDKGLGEQADGVQMMKEITGLDDLLRRAVERRMFGTKMRSVIKLADPAGIRSIVGQQFDYAARIAAYDLMPIIEPEVDIRCPEKEKAEIQLKAELLRQLDGLPAARQVMLKLTIPTVADFYADLIAHPRVLRVVALSGGYSRDEANRLLALNHGMTASFSRALSEGLTAQQSDAEFDRLLTASIDAIFAASIT
jgi:fructose-bisphosphate aldolase, class I